VSVFSNASPLINLYRVRQLDLLTPGLAAEVKPLLDTLRDPAGFWISEALIHRVLQNEGELPICACRT
jgi:predicted nucleic acid-binding protein